ncbi:MAG TPA: 16S rRNA methyltransferase [Thermoplasmata archaeon]|nr:16S rRNA methyltransferase [Thermoplasmata archaeon]
MLTLILAEAELELVPAALAGHPAVRTSAKRRGRSPRSILLDSSLHHPALRSFPEGERRGRPDIAHLFVLLCLDSRINLAGELQTIIHTRNDDVLRFSRETRIPKNYTRFVGLMEDLFAKGRVPEDKPLITLERDVPLPQLLKGMPGEKWACTEDGERIGLFDEISRVKGDLVALVGGFPHGKFHADLSAICDRLVSIHSEPLRAWTVTSEILVAFAHRSPAVPPKAKVRSR